MERATHRIPVDLSSIHFGGEAWDLCESWVGLSRKLDPTLNTSLVNIFAYMASNESCFIVTWIIFKNHLLEVGLIQNRETMTLWTLTTVGLFYFNNVWGLAWIEIHWLRVRSHMASHYTWGPVTTLHDVGGALGRPLDAFFWALTINWSRLFGSCVTWP